MAEYIFTHTAHAHTHTHTHTRIYIYILFICSSTDGLSCCFRILATANYAAMNIGCIYLSQLVFSLSWINTKEQNCWITCYLYFLFFEESLNCFLQQLYQSIFPPTVHEGGLQAPRFFTFSLTRICCLFDNNHSDRCKLTSHCGFGLYLP